MSKIALSLLLAKKASELILEKPKLSSISDLMSWTKRAIELLGEVSPVKNDPDHDFLQQVIKSELPNMNDPEIGIRMQKILQARAEEPSLVSYLQQAMAVYRDAIVSISNQFLWGNT